MRVLHFFKTYYPDTVGGIEQVIFQLCRSSGQFDVTSSVLSLSRKKLIEPSLWKGMMRTARK